MGKPLSNRKRILWGLGVLFALSLVWSGLVEAAAQKIYYFVNGPVPNVTEAANIAKLNAIRGPAFQVKVQNVHKTTRCPTMDYIAGNIPPVCRDGGIDSGTSLYTVADPSTPPAPNTLPSNEIMLYNGQTVTLPGGGSLHVHVSGGSITATTYVAPDAGL